MNRTVEPVKLLVIEDDPILGRSIYSGLSEEGYQCRLCESGPDAVQFVREEQFRVVILDLALEDESGLGVLRCIREANENAHVILLTPLEFRQERQAGLEAGADDFLIKPFALSEMRARVEAVLIRSKARPKTMLEVGPITMNLTSRRVLVDGKQLALTPTEFRILEILMRNQGKAVTRRMLCEFLWEPDWEGVTNVIEVHINRLRSKLKSGSDYQFIYTIRGSGYSLRWEPGDGEQPHNGQVLPAASATPEEMA